MTSDAYDAEVERIARLLCEGDGMDPDQLVVSASRNFAIVPENEPADAPPLQQPRWALYRARAHNIASLIDSHHGPEF
jgi:hypothetical protein